MIFGMNQTNLLVLIIILWTVPWKIYAVWAAVQANHKKWFVALLFLNTVGILEIVYIFKILKKSTEEVKSDFKQALNSFKKQ